MDDPAELRELRERLDALESRLDAAEALDLSGGRSVLARTVTLSSYPTSGTLVTFACQKLDLLGAETEGAAASVTPDPSGGTFLAVCLGPGLPPNATQVLLDLVDYAHVFRYDG